MKRYTSQCGQDEWVLRTLKWKEAGLFIEAGADNGIHHSNTYALEKFYKWRGICIEPFKDRYRLLVKNRKCTCLNHCLYSSDTMVEFVDSHLSGGISGFDSGYNVKGPRRRVRATTLDSILDHYYDTLNNDKFYFRLGGFDKEKIRVIDYLSLDTEGSEFEILKNFPFNRYRFTCMTIEHNYCFNHSSLRDQLRKLLKSHGYRIVRELNHEDWWCG